MKHRSAMLGTEMRRLLAPALRMCPQECGVVNITEIEISDDLSYVTVLITALKEPELALEFLQGEAVRLRKELGKLETHRTPKVRFKIDRLSEQGNRVEQLIEESLKKDRRDTKQ